MSNPVEALGAGPDQPATAELRLPKAIADDVWCLTCDHAHIPSIPAVTFMCADCGFGQWAEDIAEDHATDYPDHVVYPCHHRTVPL